MYAILYAKMYANYVVAEASFRASLSIVRTVFTQQKNK